MTTETSLSSSPPLPTTSKPQPPPKPTVAKHPLWQQYCLGGMSCAIATTFTHPIDTVKLRLQLQGPFATAATPRYSGVVSAFSQVTRTEGPGALYLGLSSAILRATTYSATRLGMYEPLRTLLTEQAGREKPTFPIKVAAAVTSGALGAFVGNPFELIKVRMQQGKTHQYRHVFHALGHITKNEGFTSLWIGTYPAAVRAALLTSSQLATYDHCKGIIKRKAGLEEGLPAHLAAAMTAGLVTTTVSTPADVIKSVVMNSKPRLQPIDCLRHIVRTEGLRGLLRGWTANYIRLGPHTLITIVSYEKIRTALGWSNL